MPRPYDPGLRRTAPRGFVPRMMFSMLGQGRGTQICPDTPRLDGRLALVTGGTGGIGAEIVKGLGARGAEVIVAARGQSGSGWGEPDAQCARWSEETGAAIHFLPMDLGEMASVAAAVQSVQARWPGRPVDILCANAGLSPVGHRMSADGYEIAFAVNCLGHHILVRALMAAQQLASGARIVGTTGDIYFTAQTCTKDYVQWGGSVQAYARSKLGNLWQFGELAWRHPEYRTISIHPGVVATGLIGGAGGLTGAVKALMFLPPDLGAQASLIAATQDLPNGAYFHNIHGLIDLPEGDPAADTARAAAFWEDLETLARPVLQEAGFRVG